MGIRLQDAFEVDVDPERAWEVLADPARVVGCIPSADVAGVVDDGWLEAEVGFGMGPFGASVPARFRLEAADRTEGTVRIVGEVPGDGSGAEARLVMETALDPGTDGTARVRIRHEVELGGRLATLGESAIARNMADMLFGRFVRSLREAISSRP